MPILEKIVISNFRNIEFQELVFSPKLNCISGNNGEGKTNLMDAIYYLSMTKSAFANSDRFVFRHGTDTFSLCGTYIMEGRPPCKFAVKVVSGGEKKFRKDDKAYDKISAHIGTLPIVIVSPSDIALVSESGEERRRFVNSVISQMDREYLDAAQQYNRLLAQRNRLLKDSQPDRDLLDVLANRMGVYAQKIFSFRKQFATDLKTVIKNYYSEISGDKENIGIEYHSDLGKADLQDVLRENLDKDLALGFTTAGIHRDDFIFTMNGHPIRRYGSQGQQKSFIVSLKFAQYEIMKTRYGFPPTLLLDDVFDKLDMSRISNLLAMVSGSDFGQIFITDSNKVRLSSMVDNFTAEKAYFEASCGTFSKIE